MSKKKAFALRMNEEMLKAIEKWAADEFQQHQWPNRVDAHEKPEKKPNGIPKKKD